MGKKIYLVEDEKNLNLLLTMYLEKEGYEVTPIFDGNSAMRKIEDLPDLWILDIMLPDIDGYQLIKSIKGKNKNTPVIFMSARNEELDRVVGLELGSDDYLSKPFLPRELVIRTNKLIERVYPIDNKTENKVHIEGYTIDHNQRLVFFGKDEIQLTHKEFELLTYLIDNKKIVVSREQTLLRVWGNDYFGSDRVVDDTIRRLRKKLENINIDTVYGYGYRLVIKDEEA